MEHITPPPPHGLSPGPRGRSSLARGGTISPHTVHAEPPGPVGGRKKPSQKLTKALSGSETLRIAEDEPVAVCYVPRAFEDLRELEGAA